MPTVMNVGPYRFYFFSDEGNEPAHIHVRSGNGVAKFWLNPVQLAANRGFRGHELNEIRRLVEQHRQAFEDAWNDYFGHP